MSENMVERVARAMYPLAHRMKAAGEARTDLIRLTGCEGMCSDR